MQANQITLMGKIKKLESQNEEGKASESSLQSTIAAFEEKLRLRNEELLTDKRKNEELRVKAEEKVMYLQLQINNVKGREEQMNTDSITLKKEAEKMKEMISERELIIAQRKELIEKLQNKLFENENDIGSFRQRIQEAEKNLTAAKLLKDEKDALLSSLRKDMRAMFDSKEQAILRVQELEEYKLKRENIEVKVVGENFPLLITCLLQQCAVQNYYHCIALQWPF
jgi:chromosome segregation ATPase